MRRLAVRQNHALQQVFKDNGISHDSRVSVRAFPGPRFISWRLGISNPTQLKKALGLGEQLALVAGVENVIATRQRGILRFDFSLPSSHWISYGRHQLQLASSVGIVDRGTRQEMELAWKGHKIIAGATDSGKSVMIQSAVVSLVETHEAGELDLLIASPHGQEDFLDDEEGVDFGRLPHLAADIATKRDEIEGVIRDAWAIYRHREEHNLTEANGRAKKLALVVDEVQHDAVLGLTPKSDNQNLVRLQHLATESRKFNVRLIIGTQKPSQKALPLIFDNLGDRYVGKVQNAATSVMLTGLAGANAHMLTGRGDFYHVENGSVVRFQVAQPVDGNGRYLPSGPMNVLPARMQEQQPVPNCDFTQSGGVGRPATTDWELLGRIFAVGLFRNKAPGSSIRKRWGINPTKLKNHLIMFNNSPLRDFLDGFIAERNYLHVGGTS